MSVIRITRSPRFDPCEQDVVIEYCPGIIVGDEIKIEIDEITIHGERIEVSLDERIEFVNFIALHGERMEPDDGADLWVDEQFLDGVAE